MKFRALALAVAVVATTAASSAFNFSISELHGVTLSPATSLQFGPDNRLYVAQVDGQIKALTVQRLGPNNYQVAAEEVINLVREIPNYDDDGVRNYAQTTRQVTGLLVVGTAARPVVYVSSSDPRIGGGSGGNDLKVDTNSGVISRLTFDGAAWSKVDIVRGLPRSEENHSTNGMQLDQWTNTLYVAQGGNTNAGGPSNNFAFMCETALSAAVLSVDLNVIDALPVKVDAYGQRYLYNLPTLDDPNPARARNPDGSNVNDPFGGNDGLNQAKLVEGGPVQVYASGFRNPYDLVLTRTPGAEGRLYTFDNGPNNGWGGYPTNEGTANVTNQYPEGEPGIVTNKDNLHLITGRGFYGGHPNPVRANPAGAGWFHFDDTQPGGAQKIFSLQPTSDWPSVPLALADPQEGDYRQAGVDDGALLTYSASTNGLAEYIATNFNGGMRGNLIASSYDGRLLRIVLSADGKTVTNGVETLATGFGALPLDVTAPDPGHGAAFVGTIWVTHYSPAKISVLEPADFDSPGSSTCTGINSFDVDEDGDGYSNADEIANNSDPCSAAIRPPDVDGDHVSDLIDGDDDNDGNPDTQDPFPVDPLDGKDIALPAHFELFNDEGHGFFGVGMTGLMMNRGNDYLALISDDNVIAGGTSGLFTIAQAGPGTPRGSANAQKDAYQFAINSDEFTSPYLITSRLGGPFFNSAPTGNQTQGIYLGSGDQDNYVSVALHANGGTGGIEVVYEKAGAIIFQHLYPFTNLNNITTVDLSFRVDPAAGTVQPGYRTANDQPMTPLGEPAIVSGDVLMSIMGPKPLAIGLFANTGDPATPTFAATWDYFDIAVEANTAIAKLTVDPSGSDMATSSTFGTNAFQLENLSTGGQSITSFKLDISTAIFPDIVYDPAGTAGDPDHKAFQTNSSSSGISGVNGFNTKPHNGTDSADGYDELDINFATFSPGSTLGFSIDIDPTSVKGAKAPGPGDSASVSGLELIGSTAEVFFSDGTVQRTRLGALESSVDASYAWLRADKPPKPGIAVLGKPATSMTGQQETIRVSGPAGLGVTLTIIEGALYTDGVPGGGYDLDPYEANTAIKLTTLTGVLPSEGFLDFAVMPTKSNDDGGFNFITAVLSDSRAIKGPASDRVELWYDPAFASDSQPPTSPGNLATSAITSRSVALSWSASSDNVGVSSYRVLRNGTIVSTTTGLAYTDIGLDPGITYHYSVVARDQVGNASPAATVDATTVASGNVILRVNAGGSAYVDKAGNTWAADNGYNTGSTSSTTLSIDRTIDDALFQIERYDPATAPELTYSFNVPNGHYEVQLYLTEVHGPSSAVGQRVFDVSLEGQEAFHNVDIFALAGAPAMAVVVAADTTVNDGQLNLAFTHEVQNPKVNAIKVVALTGTPGGDTSPPTAPGPLAFTNVTAGSVKIDWPAATDNIGVTSYRVSRDGSVLTSVTGLTYTDTGLDPNTAYSYSVVALDSSGNVSPASSATVTTTSASTTLPTLRINAGGGSYTDPAGHTWAADKGFNTGETYKTTASISGTTTPTLFKTERFDRETSPELLYAFSVPNGPYRVRLFFSENYAGTSGAGLRVFDVDLQDQRAFEDVDIFTQAGGANQALMLEKAITVTDGQIRIRFLHQVQNPKVNAIEIVPDDSTPPADTEPPTVPGSLTFTGVTASDVTLNWGAATDNVGVTGYRISRDNVVLTTVTGLSYTDSGLSPNTTYSYSVVALDAAANTSPAATDSVSTTTNTPPADTEPPTAPGSLTFTGVTANNVTLNWSAATDNVGVTGYRISRDNVVLGTVTGLSYTDSGLNPSTTYHYSVVALDSADNASAEAAATVATVSSSTGPAVTSLTLINTSSQQELRTLTEGSTIDLSTDGSSLNLRANVSGTIGSVAFVLDGATYRVENAAPYALAGDSSGSYLPWTPTLGTHTLKAIPYSGAKRTGSMGTALEITFTVVNSSSSDTQPPTAPGALTFTSVTSTAATINWSAATDDVGVTGYRISRGGVDITTVSGLSYRDTSLSPSTTYNYSIVALDTAGNASNPAAASVTTTAASPALAVTSLTLINTSTQQELRTLTDGSTINLSSDGRSLNVRANVSGSVGSVAFVLDGATYSVENAAPYALAGDSSGNYLPWTPAAGTHTLRVIPYSGAKRTGSMGAALEVTFSVADAGAPSDSQPPTAPGALTFTGVSSSAVTLNWSAATDNVAVTGYRVSRNGVELTTVTDLSYTDSGLTATTTYSYSVVAVDAANNASPASSANVTTSATATVLPTIRINAGGGSYTDMVGHTWSADSGYNTGEIYTTTATTSGTTAPTLFKTERFDRETAPELLYTFTVPNGAYRVRLLFAENYAGTSGAGLRVFDVDLQDQRAFEDVDIFSQAGGANKALTLEQAIAVTDGQIRIRFLHQVQNPKVNAIEIVPDDSTP